MDHEIIDASAANSGEALKALARLRESLQTLPFFGSGKAVWFQDCNFLGDDRTATAQAVTETLGELAQELKDFAWTSVRLLISAGKVDKRKVFYKTIDKLGAVESFAGWSVDDRNWAGRAGVGAAGVAHAEQGDFRRGGGGASGERGTERADVEQRAGKAGVVRRRPEGD